MVSNRRNSGRKRTREFEPNKFGLLLAETRRNTTTLSQVDLARRLHLADSSVSNYESGASFPSKSIAEELGRELKTDLMPAWYEVKAERQKNRKPKTSESPLTVRILPPNIKTAIRAALGAEGYSTADSEKVERLVAKHLSTIRRHKQRGPRKKKE
ncbi:MAG: hypothetical protein DMF68_01510 [Acidobacteria bacterium]|nr:MAG: hypothetical protein DMF68_01510 [Acidobacteriota bacterium]